MRYVAALPGENAACVCYGPRRVFEHIGMVPLSNAESYAQPTWFLLERRDARARGTHYRKGASIAGLSAEERHGMQPSPWIGFDAVDRQ